MPDVIIKNLPFLLHGLWLTVDLSVWSIVLGTLLGLAVGTVRFVRVPVLNTLAAVYVEFIRGTPLLVVLFISYFALPALFGYRTTAYVVSPYTKRKQVVSTQYNTVSLIRTMELILGLPPMNQMDATATPMFDCFSLSADNTPFSAMPNNVPLDQINPDPKKIGDPLLRRYARLSGRLPLKAPDQCPDDLLNHILWFAMKGSQTPYPTWAVSTAEDRD